MASVIDSAHIVLKGEFAAVKDNNAVIKTTIPKTCAILTLLQQRI